MIVGIICFVPKEPKEQGRKTPEVAVNSSNDKKRAPKITMVVGEGNTSDDKKLKEIKKEKVDTSSEEKEPEEKVEKTDREDAEEEEIDKEETDSKERKKRRKKRKKIQRKKKTL